MAKNKTDKKVNKLVKNFNKKLKEDLFKDRFWVRQYQKARIDGLDYYLYELKDRLEPERDRVIRKWLYGKSYFFMDEIWEGMNDFIIKSDFWDLYWRNEKDENEQLS